MVLPLPLVKQGLYSIENKNRKYHTFNKEKLVSLEELYRQTMV